MLQFMCCAAERYSAEGITVNAICPNFVRESGSVRDLPWRLSD